MPLLLINLFTGVPIRWTLLFFPISVTLLAAFALGIGLLISTFAVYYPDVVEMYNIALLGWMYLTPVIYPAGILPENIRLWVTRLNPMYYFIEIYRSAVYYGRLPTLNVLIPAIGFAMITMIIGWVVFTYKSDEFSYRI